MLKKKKTNNYASLTNWYLNPCILPRWKQKAYREKEPWFTNILILEWDCIPQQPPLYADES